VGWAGAVAALLVSSCRSSDRDPLLTYFNGEFGLTVRYPASWKTEQARQEGVWYRYFLAPPGANAQKPEVSVTLLAGPLHGALEDHAQTYLAGNGAPVLKDEERQGAKGHSYAFSSADGATRYALILLQDANRVVGLYAQGEAAAFSRHKDVLDDMAQSLTLERADAYREVRDPRFRFSIRIPPSWAESRRLGGGKTTLIQFASPPLAADKGGQTVHASLTVAAEEIGGDGKLETFYDNTRLKLGSAFDIMSHRAWHGGYADEMGAETSMAASRAKRFYLAADGRGYSLAFEAREDVFSRVSRWCDLIAETFKVGAEAGS
jgi:hypothetical protein